MGVKGEAVMPFLADLTWSSISALVGGVLFSILVGLILYSLLYKQGRTLYLLVERILRRRKEIAYKVIVDVPIISFQEEDKGEIQVLFDGEPMNHVRLVVLQIWNSGDVSVNPFDFIRPIKFSFGKKARILEAEILETEPDSIEVSLLRGENDVILKPLLLKSQGSIKLRVLLKDFKGKIIADARIVGVGIIDHTNYLASHKSSTQSTQRGQKSLIGI